MTTTTEVNGFTGKLAELVKQVQAGNEVLLTQDDKTVAKLVPASGNEIASGTTFQIHSLKGHRVLTPVISNPNWLTKCSRANDRLGLQHSRSTCAGGSSGERSNHRCGAGRSAKRQPSGFPAAGHQ